MKSAARSCLLAEGGGKWLCLKGRDSWACLCVCVSAVSKTHSGVLQRAELCLTLIFRQTRRQNKISLLRDQHVKKKFVHRNHDFYKVSRTEPFFWPKVKHVYTEFQLYCKSYLKNKMFLIPVLAVVLFVFIF